MFPQDKIRAETSIYRPENFNQKRRRIIQKYVYLWGGTTVGVVGEISRVNEQDLERESRLKHRAREAWEEEHHGEFLQLVVSENRPDMR